MDLEMGGDDLDEVDGAGCMFARDAATLRGRLLIIMAIAETCMLRALRSWS